MPVWCLKSSILYHYLTFHAPVLAMRIAAMGCQLPRGTVPFRHLVRHITLLFFSLPLFPSLLGKRSSPLIPILCVSWVTKCGAPPSRLRSSKLISPSSTRRRINNGLTPFYGSITAEFVKHWESPTPMKPLPKGMTPKQYVDKERGRVSCQENFVLY